MKLTTIKVNRQTTVRTKQEKIEFLLKKRLLKKEWKEDFIDEETGQVVTIKRTLRPKWLSHPELNRMIFRNFEKAQKI